MIEITQNYGCANVLTLGTSELTPQQVHDHAAVPEGSQVIVRRFETHLLARLDETIFQVQDSLSCAEASLELIGNKGLDEVIVGAGLQTSYYVFLRFARGEQNHINVILVAVLANFAANAGAIDFRHHPIKKCEARSIRGTELFDSLTTIGDRHDFVAGTYEGVFQEATGQRVIVSDQYFHGRASAR